MSGFPDDRSDVLAPKGLGDVPLLEAVDDLDLIDHLAVLDDFETGPFDDQIIQVPRQKLLNGDLGDELRFRVLLGIIRIEAVLVLHEDAALGADQIGKDQGAHIGPVNRNPPAGGPAGQTDRRAAYHA